MKIWNILNGFAPLRKCSVMTPLAAAVTGGTSALNAATTIYTNNQNLKNQRSENQKNRDFSHDEAEIARNWQADQWLKQYNLQRDEWYKQQQSMAETNYQQFLREAEYNSPTNQVKRLSQAGFNPSAVLSGNGTGLVSAASGNMQNVGSMSVPTGGSLSGAQAAAPAAPLPQQRSVDLSFIGTMFKDIAEGTKTNASLQPLLDQMAAQTQLFLRQAVGQGLANEFQEVQNLVAKATQNTKINQAFADLGLTYAETYLKYKEGEKIDSDILVNKTLEALNMSKKKMNDQEYQQLLFAVAHLQEGWDNMLKNDASQRALNYANAENAHENAVDTLSTRPFRQQLMQAQIELTNIQRELGKNQDAFEDNTFSARVDAVLVDLQKNQALTEETRQKIKESRQRIKLLRKEHKWFDARVEAEIAARYINAASSAISSVLPFF